MQVKSIAEWSILHCFRPSLLKLPFEPRHEISNNVVCATSKGSNQPAHTHSLIRAFASFKYSMTVKLLMEQHLEFLSIMGGCTGSSEFIHVKIPHCSKSHVTHVTAHLSLRSFCLFLSGSFTCRFYCMSTHVRSSMFGTALNTYC